MIKKMYTFVLIVLCCSQAMYSQTSIQNDSLELIKHQIKGIEEKLRLGALEKHNVADTFYNLWKSNMELKLNRLILIKEEYEK